MTVRFTRAELEAFQGATVDDLLGPDVRLLFVGINPGLWTAAVNAHFARRGNRFWPALYRAGITSTQVDASGGMPADARAELVAKGVGITNLVPVATARADELTAEQLRDGGARLRQRVAELRPAVVAMLGLTAFREAFGVRKAPLGRSDDTFEGAELWLLPNPSGLNAHHTVESLADWYGRAAIAAGVIDVNSRG
ncbi:MAG TPA: mismatch-specific DNA-glycosylase [Ilumatobacter sp.]|nr:mismatch-specific DNA-glycosylase [Ilumatobacter sp.]